MTDRNAEAARKLLDHAFIEEAASEAVREIPDASCGSGEDSKEHAYLVGHMDGIACLLAVLRRRLK